MDTTSKTNILKPEKWRSEYDVFLVRWFFPTHLKNIRQIVSWNPKDRGEHSKNVWKHHLVELEVLFAIWVLNQK